MNEAVIVATARTPIGKAYRGGSITLAAPAWVPPRWLRWSGAPVSIRPGWKT